MKLKAIFREVKLDVLTGTAHLVAFAFILIMVATSLSLADMIHVNSLIKAANAYQEAGASVAVLSAPGQINGSACDALSDLPGISSSGAVREESDRIKFTVLKAAPVPIFTVTPGFAELLQVKTCDQKIGIYLSDQVFLALQTKFGESADTSEGIVDIGGTYNYPDDGRVPGYGYAALIPSADTEPYNECWANIWPQSDEVQTLMYTTIIAGQSDAEAPIVMGQLNTTLGSKFGGQTLYNDRITKLAVVITGISSLGIGYIYAHMRRLEIASNLHAGVSRKDQAIILSFEIAAWLLPALLVSEAILVLYGIANKSSDSAILLLIANRNQYAAAVGVTVGASIAWITTKEKYLFKYFKTR